MNDMPVGPEPALMSNNDSDVQKPDVVTQETQEIDWIAVAEAGMRVRLEAQAPSGKWIAIFPAQLEQMIQQGLPVRATEIQIEEN